MARAKKEVVKQQGGNFAEINEALKLLEKEKNISRYVVLEAIENSLLAACKQYFGSTDYVSVTMDRETAEYHVFTQREVVEEVFDPAIEISLEDAKKINEHLKLGDMINEEFFSQNFSRVASQNAKNVIQQKLREEERIKINEQFRALNHGVVTGIVRSVSDSSVQVSIIRNTSGSHVNAYLQESEQIKSETYRVDQRLKLYVLDVKSSNHSTKILVSRTHPELVRHLIESEVTEVRDGIVEIKSIAREAGSRTKIAVWSNDPNVDPVGACVGQNGNRVNAIVNELSGEKLDVICWDDNPAILIQNALSPAKVIGVMADADEKTAKVIVPDYQLSLAIGLKGQNARLAARLTGYKIDIKDESTARKDGDFGDYEEGEYYEEDGEYYEDGEFVEEGIVEE